MAARRSTILTFHPVLLHLGFVIVGLPYSFKGQMGVGEVMGNSPYGASTIAGGDGSRQPSEVELEACATRAGMSPTLPRGFAPDGRERQLNDLFSNGFSPLAHSLKDPLGERP